MNAGDLQDTLHGMAALDGMQACALLDADTGMSWLTAAAPGAPDRQALCEAATDYWRLHRRLGFAFDEALGTLAAQVVIHRDGRLTLVACGDRLLLVSVSDEPDRVPWQHWKPMVRRLQEQARQL